MILLSEAFSLIGQDNCQDVATSLLLQGTDPQISIPIYEMYNLKLLTGENTNFLVGSIQEYNFIRKLAVNCGAVAATINVLNVDVLTLVGALLVYTPNTGMNVFIKDGEIPTAIIGDELTLQLADMSGVQPSGFASTEDFLNNALPILYNRLIENMSNDLDNCGINMYSWDDLPEYYDIIHRNGDIMRMAQFRKETGAAVL